MNNDNQAEIQAHLLNSIQRMEQANQLMDQANANLDRTINQARNQGNCFVQFSRCFYPFILFIMFGMFCAIIAILLANKFRDAGSVAGFLILYPILYLCYVSSQRNSLNTMFTFLRVTPVNKEEFISKMNEIFNARPKVTLSGEVFKFSPSPFSLTQFENGMYQFKHQTINSINENYSFNVYKDYTPAIKLNSVIFQNKKFIVFNFQTAVVPGDAETLQDYEQRKRAISERLGNVGIENPSVNDMQRIVRGELLQKEVKLKATAEGINNKEKCIVLSLDGSRPCWYGTCLYYLFMLCPLLPFLECFKSYVLSVTAFKVVTLSKVISVKEQSDNLIDREHSVVFPDDEIAMVEINNNEENGNNVAIPINNAYF